MTDQEPSALVEHFFRHEYGRLVSLLTSALGVRHLELVEDVVQMALWRALHSWSRQGIPDEPAAWLYRTARNLATDALRRDVNFARIAADLSLSHSDQVEGRWNDHNIEDDSLRLLFLCCHPAIAVESQIALALKIIGGFSVMEIASGLLVSCDNIEKRLSRAKAKLRELGQELATMDLTDAEMLQRREAVLQVLYLMFNEGFAASSGTSPIKRDLCDEAMRLTRMLGAHSVLGDYPAVDALLALMLMHAARFGTRVDSDECVVLLADQDRAQWDWHKVRQAMEWMLRAARGDQLSRYHVEVAIAWEHCRAADMATTDWQRVLELYDLLLRLAPSPMVRLNRTVAQSYAQSVDVALQNALAFSAQDRKHLRPWWDCVMAEFFQRLGKREQALSHLRDALALAGCAANRMMIQRKIEGMLSEANRF